MIAAAVAVVIGKLQGYESIVFAFWGLIYWTVILFVIKFCRWELHLPIKIVTIPDCRLCPKDTP